MGNTIFIKGKKICAKPMRPRIEATESVYPPGTPKGCRNFAGVVTFLKLFCPDLHTLKTYL